jgi:hypothetical protein
MTGSSTIRSEADCDVVWAADTEMAALHPLGHPDKVMLVPQAEAGDAVGEAPTQARGRIGSERLA